MLEAVDRGDGGLYTEVYGGIAARGRGVQDYQQAVEQESEEGCIGVRSRGVC